MTKPLCIYHGNCADGFGAAWVVRRALGAENVDFYPGVYQRPPPDVTDRDVVIVDFSYKRPVLLEMAERAKSIEIIDHHKTAAADLVDLPANVKTTFDMEKSGAMLAWERYFFAAPPKLIEHIQDRDLWRFALPHTREIQAALFSYPYDFDVWNSLILDGERALSLLASDGSAIERKHHKDIAELLPVVRRELMIGGYLVPAANVPYFYASDAGHALAQGAPFAACYYDKATTRAFSLRSTDDGLDVSEIARIYGGGGHMRAAGFEVPFAVAIEFEPK